jgi:hypothetical protein
MAAVTIDLVTHMWLTSATRFAPCAPAGPPQHGPLPAPPAAAGHGPRLLARGGHGVVEPREDARAEVRVRLAAVPLPLGVAQERRHVVGEVSVDVLAREPQPPPAVDLLEPRVLAQLQPAPPTPRPAGVSAAPAHTPRARRGPTPAQRAPCGGSGLTPRPWRRRTLLRTLRAPAASRTPFRFLRPRACPRRPVAPSTPGQTHLSTSLLIRVPISTHCEPGSSRPSVWTPARGQGAHTCASSLPSVLRGTSCPP